MSDAPLVLTLADEAATLRLAEALATRLASGDVIALEGDLGAGKTTLARALIRAVAGDPALEVPSPTFTIVQTYPGRVPIAHFDLYRLGSPDELDEIGFDEAVADGAVLIEWPERGGNRIPSSALTIRLEIAGEGRRAALSGGGGRALPVSPGSWRRRASATPFALTSPVTPRAAAMSASCAPMGRARC